MIGVRLSFSRLLKNSDCSDIATTFMSWKMMTPITRGLQPIGGISQHHIPRWSSNSDSLIRHNQFLLHHLQQLHAHLFLVHCHQYHDEVDDKYFYCEK